MVNRRIEAPFPGEWQAKALETIIRYSEDYIFIKDKNLVYQAASEPVAIMAGQPSAQAIVGKDDYAIFPRALAERYRADDRSVLAGAAISGMVEQLPDCDGRPRWSKTWKQPIYDDDGQLIGLYGISRDVTREVVNEEEAKAARPYIDLLNNVPGGIGIMHRSGDQIYLDYANDGFMRAHHTAAEHRDRYLGSRITDHVCEEDRVRIFEQMADSRRRGHSDGVTYRVTGEDGQPHWIDIQLRFAYTRDGMDYYYASYTDLDKQKQAELKLQESQDTLKEAINNSDVQYFTYFPKLHRTEIYALNERYTKLVTRWDNFPDTFLDYVEASPRDARIYREMVARIDAGADEASCQIRMRYRGVYLWMKVTMTAVRDKAGEIVKALGYSIDVTAQKNAEDRLRKERLRIKSLEGNLFEAFSFNLTHNGEASIETSDEGVFAQDLTEELVREARRIAPPIGDTDAETREIMLRVLARIPDAGERELFLNTCSGSALRKACSAGIYEQFIRYRRYIGREVRWVSTRVEVLPDPRSGDLIVFFYTRNINDEIIDEKIAQRIIMNNYLAVTFYDVQTDTMHVRMSSDGYLSSIGNGLYTDCMQRSIAHLVTPEDRPEVLRQFDMETIRKGLETQETDTFYFIGSATVESLPGSPRQRLKNDAFYLDDHRDIIVLLLSDVTEIFEEEREHRERLAEALAEAEQANHAKSDFLSRISHDIRTPMNVINSKTDFAFEDIDDRPRLIKDLEDIRTSSTFLLSLVNDILDLSKIDSGIIELHPGPYDFRDYRAMVQSMFTPLCTQKGIAFDIGEEPGTPAIMVDRIRLNQITLNLLSNAVKYTPKGGTIAFRAQGEKQADGRIRCKITVADDGAGMSLDFQQHMFEPFTRDETKGDLSLSEQGTGLGLSIVKRIVDLMEGSIVVDSRPAQGTRITVRFICAEAPAKPGAGDGDPAGLSALSGQVLLAEDHPMNAEIATRLLTSYGLSVVWARDGRQAAELFEAARPGDFDVILMDIQMPVLDGYGAARRIRALDRPDARAIPIIAMTANAYSEDVRRCLEAGMNGHVPKPIDARTLRSTLAAALQSDEKK